MNHVIDRVLIKHDFSSLIVNQSARRYKVSRESSVTLATDCTRYYAAAAAAAAAAAYTHQTPDCD
jgi:hypothetical protein